MVPETPAADAGKEKTVREHTVTLHGHTFRVISGRLGSYCGDERNNWGFTAHPRGWKRFVWRETRRYFSRPSRFRRAFRASML